MNDFERQRLRRHVTVMADEELHRAITVDRNKYFPDHLNALEEEFRRRKAVQSDAKKLRPMKKWKSSLRARGYRKVKDSIGYLDIIATVVLLIAWLIVDVLLDYGEDGRRLFKGYGWIGAIFLGIIFYVIRSFFIFGKRRCPACRTAMTLLVPQDQGDGKTYQYYCASCQVYIDTDVPVKGGV